MKKLLIAFTVGAMVAGAGVAYWRPRIVTKVETVEKQVVKNNIQTVVRTVERPDGSREIIKTINDTSTRTEDKTSLKEVYKQSDWAVGLSAGTRLTDIDPVYALHVQRRIIGPIFAGAYGRTDGEVGLSVLVTF